MINEEFLIIYDIFYSYSYWFHLFIDKYSLMDMIILNDHLQNINIKDPLSRSMKKIILNICSLILLFLLDVLHEI